MEEIQNKIDILKMEISIHLGMKKDINEEISETLKEMDLLKIKVDNLQVERAQCTDNITQILERLLELSERG